jgi:hypothetical protein
MISKVNMEYLAQYYKSLCNFLLALGLRDQEGTIDTGSRKLHKSLTITCSTMSQSTPHFCMGTYYALCTGTRREFCPEACCICLEEFESDDEVVQSRTCHHIHHQDCLNTWIQRQNSCPCCRRPLVEASSYRTCHDDDDFIDG